MGSNAGQDKAYVFGCSMERYKAHQMEEQATIVLDISVVDISESSANCGSILCKCRNEFGAKRRSIYIYLLKKWEIHGLKNNS